MSPKSLHSTAAGLLTAALVAGAVLTTPGEADARHKDRHKRTPTPTVPALTMTSVPAPVLTATRTVAPATATVATATPTVTPDQMPEVGMPYPGLSGSSDRRLIELQAWWTPNYGHIHLTAAVPMGHRLTGPASIPIRTVLHSNPSHLISLELIGDLPGGVQTHLAKISVSEVCPYNGTTETDCSFAAEWTFDSSRYRDRDGSYKPIPDGWGELQMWAVTRTPDGVEFRTSSRVPVEFANGNARGADNHDPLGTPVRLGCAQTSFQSRAWYGEPLSTYANAFGLCIPMQTVSSPYTFLVGGGNGQDGLDRTEVYLDKTHVIKAAGAWAEQPARTGRQLFAQDGRFEEPFRLTAPPLAPGWHTIAIHSRYKVTAPSVCSYCKGEQNHLWAVAKWWVFVRSS
jgi:hypothetical protein